MNLEEQNGDCWSIFRLAFKEAVVNVESQVITNPVIADTIDLVMMKASRKRRKLGHMRCGYLPW